MAAGEFAGGWRANLDLEAPAHPEINLTPLEDASKLVNAQLYSDGNPVDLLRIIERRDEDHYYYYGPYKDEQV